MAKRNGKTEVVETGKTEVVETGKNVNEVTEMNTKTTPVENEHPAVQEFADALREYTEKKANETPVETILVQQVPTSVSMICSGCDDLDVDELKEVIEYCSCRIDELQKEEVSELEEQMRAIQDKLLALKGHKRTEKKEKTEGAKRNVTPLVNPNNPSEVYTFGKTPDFVVKMMTETGKTVRELREEAAARM